MSKRTGLIGLALTGAVVVGFVMLASSETDSEKPAKQIVAKPAAKAEQEASGTFERVGRAADDLIRQAVGTSADDATTADMGEVGQAAEEAKEAAKEAKEEVAEVVNETAKEVTETAKEIGAAAAQTAASALKKAKEQTDKAIIKAEEIADKGKEKALEAADELGKKIGGSGGDG